jgi:hypothetical protein
MERVVRGGVAIVLCWEWLIEDRLVIVVLDVDVDLSVYGVGRDKN